LVPPPESILPEIDRLTLFEMLDDPDAPPPIPASATLSLLDF
jgi:hypothetical protein